MINAGAHLVTVPGGAQYRAIEVVGRGGEGEVWSAHPEGDPSGLVAVKWFYPHTAHAERYRALQNLIDAGRPGSRFLWPVSMASSLVDPDSFGYVMPLRPTHFALFQDIPSGRAPVRFSVLATVGRNLAVSLHALHAKGLCYRDISFGNVFVDPASGEVLVCDNDNVSVDGSPTLMRGTVYFMAPEVMLGDSPPSRHSDRFSLAVLLFYMLVRHHPLEGKSCEGIWDDAARFRAFAAEPLFVFDPKDNRNAPDPEHHTTVLSWWPLYPRFVRDLFTTAFTRGLIDPHARITETIWRDAMDDLKVSAIRCECGAENLYDPEATGQLCWRASCGRRISPAFLAFPARPNGRRAAVLDDGTVLTAVNLVGDDQADHTRPLASVAARPEKRGEFGLTNLSDTTWTFRPNDGGSVFDVAPGRTLRLRPGVLDVGRHRTLKIITGPES